MNYKSDETKFLNLNVSCIHNRALWHWEANTESLTGHQEAEATIE